jgi:putative tryptophan/tyrosine transport system substrate-binding protein
VRRRDFIAGLGSTATLPFAARAQQIAMPVVGLLSPFRPEAMGKYIAGFQKGLAEAGFVEGRNIVLEHRYANDDIGRFPELAAELIRRRCAVIFTSGSLVGLRALMSATGSVPIVFNMAQDPVQAGIVPSLNRPGGNVTGFTELANDIVTKRLELLHALLPGVSRFAVLFDTVDEPSKAHAAAALRSAAASKGLQIEVFPADSIAAIEAVFLDLAQRHVGGLLLQGGGVFVSSHREIIALASRYAMPTIWWERQALDGGLISYGVNIPDLYRRAAIYVGRILKGEKPGDLPVQQPTKFDLIINLNTAKALGIEVPPQLLALANEVIE